MYKKIISLFLVCSIFTLSNSMDWEDAYTQAQRARSAQMVEKAHQLGQEISHEQLTPVVQQLHNCIDPTCILNSSLKELCFDCKSAYKAADKKTKNFIKLEIALQEEQT